MSELYDRYTMETRCAVCGEQWGVHMGTACPDPYTTSFVPVQEAPSTALPADLAKNSAPLESHIDLGAPAPALARQEGGGHYKGMKIQPFEYIHANGIGFAEGCVIKYVSRWRAKNGVEDLKKARHFLDLLIEAEGA